MEAEDQDRKPRVLPLDVSEQFQPAPTGEIQVQHDRVKRPGPELVESLRRVTRLGADPHPGRIVNDAIQARPHDRVVIDD